MFEKSRGKLQKMYLFFIGKFILNVKKIQSKKISNTEEKSEISKHWQKIWKLKEKKFRMCEKFEKI